MKKDFKKWFIEESEENPIETALCALTAILLTNTFQDQNNRFIIIDNIFKEGILDHIPALKKTKEIYNIALTRQHNIIENMAETEKTLAQALQIISNRTKCCTNNGPKPEKCNPTSTAPKTKKEDKLQSISKWW